MALFRQVWQVRYCIYPMSRCMILLHRQPWLVTERPIYKNLIFRTLLQKFNMHSRQTFTFTYTNGNQLFICRCTDYSDIYLEMYTTKIFTCSQVTVTHTLCSSWKKNNTIWNFPWEKSGEYLACEENRIYIQVYIYYTVYVCVFRPPSPLLHCS
jgi:hypothetical protein